MLGRAGRNTLSSIVEEYTREEEGGKRGWGDDWKSNFFTATGFLSMWSPKKLGASTSTRYTIPTYPSHLAASHSLASPAGHSLVGASDITEASCHPLSQHVVCDNIGDIKLNDSDMTLKLWTPPQYCLNCKVFKLPPTLTICGTYKTK